MIFPFFMDSYIVFSWEFLPNREDRLLSDDLGLHFSVAKDCTVSNLSFGVNRLHFDSSSIDSKPLSFLLYRSRRSSGM